MSKNDRNKALSMWKLRRLQGQEPVSEMFPSGVLPTFCFGPEGI